SEHGRPELLLGFLRFAVAAVAIGLALGAGAVRQLLLVAVRTLRHAAGAQKVVRAAIGGAARRMAPLRIGHGAIPFVTPPPAHPLGSKNQRDIHAPLFGHSFGPGEAPFLSRGLNSQDLIRPRNPARASQRGSAGPSSHVHVWLFRFTPQRGQSPLQSGLHSVLAGSDKSTCSRSTSSSNRLS